eukprot:7212320-Alexandrium_andersonii.AAC.1
MGVSVGIPGGKVCRMPGLQPGNGLQAETRHLGLIVRVASHGSYSPSRLAPLALSPRRSSSTARA